jgi:hypothetical protein
MIADARPKIQGRHLPLSSPLYLLYSHAAELALKAFLGAKNIPTPERHEVAKLYEKSQRAGLVIDQGFKIENLMSFLESGNKNQGFRYFYLEPCWIEGGVMHTRMGFAADLSWVREGIPELIRVIEPHVRAHIDIGPRGAKMALTFSKPTLKPGVRLKADGA